MIYRVYKKYYDFFTTEFSVGYFSQIQFALEAVEGIKFANPNTVFEKVDDANIWKSEFMDIVIEEIKLVA